MPRTIGIFYIGLSVTDVKRSAQWYERLLDANVIREGFGPEFLLMEPVSGLEIGLMQHSENDGRPFSEFQTGLDHLEFHVETEGDLIQWKEKLDALGIEHSGIKDRPGAKMITFRDPDNIQLEFYWRKSK